ncbi:MAG: NPXTG-anchored protein [Ruminococcus sp.]|nr:NPXTG-anchored protein [Ruminococcus sp.]
MKNSLKKAFSLVALGAVAVSAASMNAFAESEDARFSADGKFSAAEIEASEIKPVITATQEVITLEDAKAAPMRKVQVSVTGANAKYAATGFHIYYDKRLEIEMDPFGGPKATRGAGAEYLTTKTPDLDPTAADFDMKGIFVCSAADMDKGLDGVVWEFNVTLPEDVAEGDVFPIDILYRSNKTNEDLFTNNAKDLPGRLMQAYTFTRGIYNPEYNPNFKAAAADVEKCAALADMNGAHDGYIAIADGEEPVTTTTTTTTTATETDTDTTPSTGASTAASTKTSTASVTSKKTTSKKTTAKSTAKTTGKKDDSPKTGVAGVGVAVAGLAVALGTAFVLRKKED